MIMVSELEYFIFIAITLKFGVKSLLSEGSGTSWGYMWAPAHLLDGFRKICISVHFRKIKKSVHFRKTCISVVERFICISLF